MSDMPMSDSERKFSELGTSGLQAYMGYVQEAYHAELHWPGVQPLYSRMRRSDPEISVVRNVYQALARSVRLEWQIPDDASDDDKRAQEFGEQVLNDIEGGPDEFLSTLISHVPFMGFGWWEVVLGVRSDNWKSPDGDDWKSEHNDNLIGIRKLAWRDHSSFVKWNMDDKTGKVKGFVQQDSPNSQIIIPLNRSLHVAFGDTQNPEGLSPLEAVWRLERIKYGLEVVQGIGFEHAAGYLDVTVNGKLTTSDETALKRAAKNIMKAQEGNYAAWPQNVVGELKDVNFSAAPSILEAIKYFGILKLMVYNMQWAALSSVTGTGSYASMTDSSQMFITVFNSMMEGLIAQVDAQLGKRIFSLNEGAFPGMTRRPKLVCTPIEKQVSLSELAAFMDSIQWMDLSEDDFKALRKKSAILTENVPQGDSVVKKKIAPATEPIDEVIEQSVTSWKDYIQLKDPDLYAKLSKAK